MKFIDLGLSESTAQNLDKLGYAEPTPIQAESIPHVLMGRDLFGCAQTGTGKTASFLLPMLDMLASGRSKARMPRCIILEPTRELAAQVYDNLKRYDPARKLSGALLVGGESIIEQQRVLSGRIDVLVATPGRMIDLFERGRLILADVKFLVIDEADRMLDMGFIPYVDQIVSLIPKKHQTLLFSATMPKEIKKLAQAYLNNPKEVIVSAPSQAAVTIDQHLVQVGGRQKRTALLAILKKYNPKTAIIFSNRKKNVDILTTFLKRYKFQAEALHGDLTQSERNRTLTAFKAGEIHILVASDVAARGLDISDLSLVVNFDVPLQAEDYIHRIGRTGRAGNKGIAVTIATKEDSKLVKAIEKLTKKEFPLLELDLAEEKPKNQEPKNQEPRNQEPRNQEPRKQEPRNQEPKKQEPRKQEPRQVRAEEKDILCVGFGDETPEYMLRAVKL